jgi:hypothetical protein
MKTKTKTVAPKYDRVPLASRTAKDILGALRKPSTTRSHAIPPVNDAKGGFSEMYHARGGRLWFQVVATPELRARVEMLKAKAGARTLNDLAAKLFDDAFLRYKV